MIIKKFTAKTEEEAVAQAKAELGENIVIMNVKTAAKKGFFGFLKKPQTEVTVAKEEESERYPYDGGAKKAKEEVDLRETFRQVAKAAGTEKMEEMPAKKNPPEENQNLLVEKLDSLQSIIEKKLQTEEDIAPEIGPEEEDNEMVRFMKLLYNTMLDNEVDEKYANQIIDEIEKNAKPNLPFDHALADVYQKMILKFGKAVPIENNGKGIKVIFFEELIQNTEQVMNEVQKFIGIKPKKISSLPHSNEGKTVSRNYISAWINRQLYCKDVELRSVYSQKKKARHEKCKAFLHKYTLVENEEKMNPSSRAFLDEFYKDSIRELEAYCGKSLEGLWY